MTESATHRIPRHVGEFHENIEFQSPAHCVKYMYSAAHFTKWDPMINPMIFFIILFLEPLLYVLAYGRRSILINLCINLYKICTGRL